MEDEETFDVCQVDSPLRASKPAFDSEARKSDRPDLLHRANPRVEGTLEVHGLRVQHRIEELEDHGDPLSSPERPSLLRSQIDAIEGGQSALRYGGRFGRVVDPPARDPKGRG